MDPDVWRAELIDELRTIADLQELESLWLGNDQAKISSFTEEVVHVFDDLDIDAFLALKSSDTDLSPRQRQTLVMFRDALLDYVNATRSTRPDAPSVLADPRFRHVSALARQFLNEVESRM